MSPLACYLGNLGNLWHTKRIYSQSFESPNTVASYTIFERNAQQMERRFNAAQGVTHSTQFSCPFSAQRLLPQRCHNSIGRKVIQGLMTSPKLEAYIRLVLFLRQLFFH